MEWVTSKDVKRAGYYWYYGWDSEKGVREDPPVIVAVEEVHEPGYESHKYMKYYPPFESKGALIFSKGVEPDFSDEVDPKDLFFYIQPPDKPTEEAQ